MEQLNPPAAARLAMVDVLDRDGRARQSLPVYRWPVRIGRALDNDLVLDDPGVAASHCQLAREEQKNQPPGQDAPLDNAPRVTLTVGDTRNGVLLEHRRILRGGQYPLASGQEWQMGQTRLRLRLADAALAPEQPVTQATGWSIATLALGVLALLGLTGLHSYLTSIAGEFVPSLAKELLTVSLMALAWSLAWSLASKMFRHRMLFWLHLAIASWAVVALELADYLLGGLSFAFSAPWLFKLRPELPWLMLAAVLYAHLALVLPRQRRGLAGITVALLAGLLGASLLMRHQETGRWLKPLYVASLPHPGLRLVKAQGVDDLLARMAEMEPILQAAARQEGNENAADAEELEIEE